MKIDIQTFKGETPRVSSRLLDTESAEYALNCLFDSGDLEALFEKTEIAAVLGPGTINSIYLYEGVHWFSWQNEVHAISSPVAQDQYARVYFTGDGNPKVTSNLIATGSDPKPAASYRLGVPAPSTTPTAAVVDGGDDDDFGTDESRAYVYTYVTEYGEEGPPSPASDILDLDLPSADAVSLVLPTLASNIFNITHKRIYRTATGGDSTEFYFVAEIPVATTTYTDTLPVIGLGPELTTYNYEVPPFSMRGLVKGANGICAGYSGNEFIPSEPYLPYAYPVEYRRSTEHDIVAIAATATGFVIGTKGKPYLVQGVHPGAMAETKVDLMQACVSKTSMVDMGAYVLYASPDGLVSISESSASVITQGILRKRDWEKFNPSTIRAFRYEDKYIAFYDDGTGGAGFIYEPNLGTITRIDTFATAGYTDLETDTLYLVIDGKIHSWETAGTRETYVWRSKVFHLPDVTFAAVKVWTDELLNVGLKLIVDGRTIMELNQLPAEAFKIPPGHGTRWQLELSGTGVVERVTLAPSMDQL